MNGSDWDWSSEFSAGLQGAVVYPVEAWRRIEDEDGKVKVMGMSIYNRA
jgi:hypothetical protein